MANGYGGAIKDKSCFMDCFSPDHRYRSIVYLPIERCNPCVCPFSMNSTGQIIITPSRGLHLDIYRLSGYLITGSRDTMSGRSFNRGGKIGVVLERQGLPENQKTKFDLYTHDFNQRLLWLGLFKGRRIVNNCLDHLNFFILRLFDEWRMTIDGPSFLV